MYSATWENGCKVYSVDSDVLEIDSEWLFKKLLDNHDWEVISYASFNNHVDLYGRYPIGKIIEIKKFFYDNYPFVSFVEPRQSSLRIYFKKAINFVYSSLNLNNLN